MRRLLVGAAVVALVAIGGPASGIAATPTPTPSASPSGPSAGLQTADAIDAELAAALARQVQLDAAKTALATEIASAKTEQSQLQDLMAANQAQITATMAQIGIEQRALADATQRASYAEARADSDSQRAATDRAALAMAMRQEYEHPDGYIGYILAGDDLQTMMDRIAQIRALTSGAADLVVRLRQEEADARAAQAEAQAQEERARQAAAALQAQKDALTAETQREQGIVDQLSGQMSAAATELHQIDGQDAAVAERVAELRIEQLDRIIADAEQAAWDAAQLYLKNNLTGLPQSAITIPPPSTAGAAVLQQTGS
ncbi:MAG TPA: hypothetical protein VFO60_02400, partial [Candidatus Dormibacteraeota bacterium]|nr:hypothetical protein [Candidatus Dormibacteraeota bacterium]